VKPDHNKYPIGHADQDKGNEIKPTPVTDEQWEAIASNDASYDGQFWYAVKTTRIFCRPSCKSRLPRRDNIGAFEQAEQAIFARYRPCKRCKPTGQRLPSEEWIAIVTDYIDLHYDEALSLNTLAHLSHGTPYHLHRTFKKIKGETPTSYLQRTRIHHAKLALLQSDAPVSEIGAAVGLTNPPYFITLFKKMTGLTPDAYRKHHKTQVEEDI